MMEDGLFFSNMLSPTDKKILNDLLDPGCRITTYDLAMKTGLPRTTVQRRRAFLEDHYLQFSYALNPHGLGFRRVDLLIETERGKTMAVARDLLKLDPVVYVGRSVGQKGIDLQVEAVVKDNSDLLDLLELVKGMEGVRDVIWSEVVQVIGRKKSIPASVIDKL